MKTILVPVDFSENAQRALAAAKIVAKSTGARVVILHVFQPYIPDISSGMAAIPVYEDLEESFKNELEKHVQALTAEGISASSLWVSGTVADTVKTQSRETGADLVVIGRTGKGGFLDKLFGSSATGIVRDSKVPVLIVPPQSTPKAFREVVYATQLEYEENHVIRQVIGLIKVLGARLTFLKISSLTQPDIQDDRQYIDQIKKEFDFKEEDFLLREAGSVIDGIEKYADELKADLLVVSARERGFLEALLINPRITRQLVLDTHIPLLVYHMED